MYVLYEYSSIILELSTNSRIISSVEQPRGATVIQIFSFPLVRNWYIVTDVIVFFHSQIMLSASYSNARNHHRILLLVNIAERKFVPKEGLKILIVHYFLKCKRAWQVVNSIYVDKLGLKSNNRRDKINTLIHTDKIEYETNKYFHNTWSDWWSFTHNNLAVECKLLAIIIN